MFSVHDQRSLSSQLLRIVGQRLAHVILNASESSERAGRLSRLPTQISSWIKSQVMWNDMFCYYLWLILQRYIQVRYLSSMFIRGNSKQLIIETSVFKYENWKLKQPPRRRQRQRQKTIGFMSKTTGLHVHHVFFFSKFQFDVHCTTTTWNLLMRWFMKDVNIRLYFIYISPLFLNLGKVLKNSTPGFDKISGFK